MEETNYGDVLNPSKKPRNSKDSLNIGVIGVGKLGSSLVQGICSQNHFGSDKELIGDVKLFLSPRGRSYVQSLKSEFSVLHVCKDNQEVMDKCKVVLMCVLPEQLPNVCKELKSTDPEQIIVSCVSGHSVADIPSLFQECATTMVCKAIPLPASAFQQGTTLLFPRIELPFNIFEHLGAVFCPRSEEEMVIYQGCGCTMGTLYKMMQTCQEWGESKGVESSQLQSYLAHVFQTFTFEAVHRHEEPNLLQKMVAEQTPGGLNEGVIADMKKEEFFGKLKTAMDRVEKRLSGAY